MTGKKPSVRIPSSVLKKEAQKMAKKMMLAEKKKERAKEIREKAKTRAANKVQKTKTQKENWEGFMDEGMRREVWGGAFLGLGAIVMAFYISQNLYAQQFELYVRMIIGRGAWFLPLIFIGIGMLFLLQKEHHFHPVRIFFSVLCGAVLLGIGHLFAPLDTTFAQAHLYGGAIGSAVSFFPRYYLGTGLAAVLLLVLAWITAVIGFGIRMSSIWAYFLGDTPAKNVPSKKEDTSPTVKTVHADKPFEEKDDSDVRHFENELEIVDASTEKKKNAGKTLDLDEKDADELTNAKNRDLSGEWQPPSLDLLKENKSTIVVDEQKLRDDADKIREKLEQFGIAVGMKSVHVGPTVTQFTLEPAPGVKLNKITVLKNDLALTLAAETIRIEAPIRGKSLVGIEIPNEKRSVVSMREILESESWKDSEGTLELAVGRDVAGKPIVVDLAKMPHLLIAGKTGSGKSVAMNAFLCSLLWQYAPEDLRLILVDPKRVELSLYNHLPHLLTPVIVEPHKSVSALAWAVAEMNRRYRAFSEEKCRNITEYNEKFPDKKEPYIVIVIDELADLMMVAGKDVEAAICRIAQMARAVGMHLIVATQRPSVDVVTGLIKANLPARIAFRVSSGIDSRTIIDGIGAEDLLGFGDMLYLDGNSGRMTRVQGIYISNEEVERITNHIKLQFPEMMTNDEITSQSIEGMAKGGVLTAGQDEDITDDDLDDKFEEAVSLVLETNKASASFLQRRLEVGYARAARILDQMESRGIIGPARGAKPREIYGRDDSSL